ncbi:hypothetical protein SteCoe_19763 [Stentor coeruleus]|uniref:Uncharacterized protein n=1 Tax=Stentor coeruleus TaxID=5963 RepID=A0A1R2BTC7_9CILI|nr:hypothetical protein SteCoe_19763 [Stentor coeruleus]
MDTYKQILRFLSCSCYGAEISTGPEMNFDIRNEVQTRARSEGSQHLKGEEQLATSSSQHRNHLFLEPIQEYDSSIDNGF